MPQHLQASYLVDAEDLGRGISFQGALQEGFGPFKGARVEDISAQD
jgi:hypothetical protein